MTMTPGTEVLFGVNIGITDGKIEFISKKVPEEMPKTIIEAPAWWAMPASQLPHPPGNLCAAVLHR